MIKAWKYIFCLNKIFVQRLKLTVGTSSALVDDEWSIRSIERRYRPLREKKSDDKGKVVVQILGNLNKG